MQARYYYPVIGRFYSNDPIGFRDIHSFNRYTYANNNPYKFTDPTGMCPADASRRDCLEIGTVDDGSDNVPSQFTEKTAIQLSESVRVTKGDIEEGLVIKDGVPSKDGLIFKKGAIGITQEALDGADAVIHGHPEDPKENYDSLNSSGDATFVLKTNIPLFVVEGKRLAVVEIDGGVLQMRMVKGRLTRGEVKRVKSEFSSQLREHNNEN